MTMSVHCKNNFQLVPTWIANKGTDSDKVRLIFYEVHVLETKNKGFYPDSLKISEVSSDTRNSS